MLRRIEQGRKGLTGMRTLSSIWTKSHHADVDIAREAELERTRELAQRLEKATRELKRMRRMLTRRTRLSELDFETAPIPISSISRPCHCSAYNDAGDPGSVPGGYRQATMRMSRSSATATAASVAGAALYDWEGRRLDGRMRSAPGRMSLQEPRKINLAPGGRIAQTVERDLHRHIWNDEKPLLVWRIKIVDFDAIQNAAGLPPLPTLRERPRHREGPPPLDTKRDVSGMRSIAQREVEQPSSVVFGAFAVHTELPPVVSKRVYPSLPPPARQSKRSISPNPPLQSQRGICPTPSHRQTGADDRAASAGHEVREHRAVRERQTTRRDLDCQCVCM